MDIRIDGAHSLGEAIRNLRVSKEFSQIEFANLLEVSSGIIDMIERDKQRTTKLHFIADLFDVKIEKLMELESMTEYPREEKRVFTPLHVPTPVQSTVQSYMRQDQINKKTEYDKNLIKDAKNISELLRLLVSDRKIPMSRVDFMAGAYNGTTARVINSDGVVNSQYISNILKALDFDIKLIQKFKFHVGKEIQVKYNRNVSPDLLKFKLTSKEECISKSKTRGELLRNLRLFNRITLKEATVRLGEPSTIYISDLSAMERNVRPLNESYISRLCKSYGIEREILMSLPGILNRRVKEDAIKSKDAGKNLNKQIASNPNKEPVKNELLGHENALIQAKLKLKSDIDLIEKKIDLIENLEKMAKDPELLEILKGIVNKK